MYLPLHNVSRKRYIFKISLNQWSFCTSGVCLGAFITCVIITMYKDFENANHTHCNVPNIFPSISASIGSYQPQKTIWKIAIYFHAPLRCVLIYLRSQYYLNVIKDNYYILVTLAVILNILENLALLGITHWSSNNDYSYHEFSFKFFIGTSLIYMLIVCIMLKMFRRRPILNKMENHSLKLKWRALCIYGGSFACAAYFFLRHNSLCEPYVYSMFAFSEYIVVFCNIAFHFTSIYDLQVEYIYFTSRGLAIE